MLGFIADYRPCVRIYRNIYHDLAEKLATLIEDLNAVVSTVCYVNVVLCIDGKAVGSVELTWLVPGLSP